jgi:chromosome segregation ATPase
MTLIRKALYEDLISSRSSLLKQLTAVTEELKGFTDALAAEQKFADDYTKTQADLEASKAAIETSIAALEVEITSLSDDKKALSAKAETQYAAEDVAAGNYKKQLNILAGLKEEKGSAEDIAAQQIVVDDAKAVLDAATAAVVLTEAQIKNIDAQIVIATEKMNVLGNTVSETNKQIAFNKEKYSNSPEQIATLTSKKAKAQSEYDSSKSSYTDFIAKNKDTISAYETQQLKRDENIRKEQPTRVYYRQPENATVINDADTVMKEVVDGELQPANETEDTARKAYIAAGAEPSVNPDYLTAAQAKDLSLSVIWSTRSVSKQIQDACLKGDFSTKCGALPNSVVYALQAAGFKLYLTDGANDKTADIIISWENLAGEGESKKEKS